MSYDRLAARLYNAPLLITPEKAEVIERVFRAHLDGTVAALPPYEAKARPDVLMQTATTFTRQRAGYLRSDSGVALIQVVGALAQRHTPGVSMSEESYENIDAQLQAAGNDPKVGGILIEFDSPGGEGAGVAGLADTISALGEQKPIVAHANEMAFSAAYWLASSAGEVYVPRTGMVGSVGVIMLHVDQSRMNDKRGLDVTHITAGARKADFSSHKPLSEAALSNAQAMVDRLYGQFVDHVAGARGITTKVVRDTEAGLLNPEQAGDLGMIDGIATLGGALDRLHVLMADPKKRRSYGRAAANAQLSQELDMSDANKGAAPNQPAANTTTTEQQLADARAAGVAEGKAATTADTAKAARDAERARISAITTHAEAAGRTKLAEHLAHKTELSVDDAVAMLAVAPKEAAAAAAASAAPANLLAAAMAGTPNPKVGAGEGEGEDSETAIAARVAGYMRANRKLTAIK